MDKFGVSPTKRENLAARMERLGVREEDLEETFIRSSGPGGQNVNKVSTCVQLRHSPTGIEVRCQDARTQALNRFLARRRLVDKIEELREGRKSAEQQRREKIRRQKRRRSRRAKAKMLEKKKQQGEKKKLRKPLPPHNIEE